MKSMPGNAGNVKMRGKKHKLMSCKCCVCKDLRGKYKEHLANKEVLQWKRSIEA